MALCARLPPPCHGAGTAAIVAWSRDIGMIVLPVVVAGGKWRDPVRDVHEVYCSLCTLLQHSTKTSDCMSESVKAVGLPWHEQDEHLTTDDLQKQRLLRRSRG